MVRCLSMVLISLCSGTFRSKWTVNSMQKIRINGLDTLLSSIKSINAAE